MAVWREGDHPRDDAGRFTDKDDWAAKLSDRLVPRTPLISVLHNTPPNYDRSEEIADWARGAGFEYEDSSGVQSKVRSGYLTGSGNFRIAGINGDFKASDGRPLGTWAIEVRAQTTGNEIKWFVDGIELRSDQRGQGIGRRWAERMEQIAFNEGAEKIELLDTSGGFWSKLGYTRVGSYTEKVLGVTDQDSEPIRIGDTLRHGGGVGEVLEIDVERGKVKLRWESGENAVGETYMATIWADSDLTSHYRH